MPQRQTYSSSNTMATIVATLMRPVPLVVVVLDPFAVNLLHFFPTLSLMEMKVSHSPDYRYFVDNVKQSYKERSHARAQAN